MFFIDYLSDLFDISIESIFVLYIFFFIGGLLLVSKILDPKDNTGNDLTKCFLIGFFVFILFITEPFLIIVLLFYYYYILPKIKTRKNKMKNIITKDK